MTFTVTRTGANATPITVNYATADDSALAGSDFAPTSGTLTFAPSASVTETQTITVILANDSTYESVEQFLVNLSGASGATIADGQGLATITNDDAAPVISVGDIVVSEEAGTATFTVTLTGPTALPISVDYATTDGTAVSTGSATPGTPDYTATSGTLNFGPSSSATQTLTVTVSLANDLVVEGTEQFVLNLSNPSNGATIADSQGIATVTDSDTLPDITPPVLTTPTAITTEATEASGARSAIVMFAASANDVVDGVVPVTFKEGAVAVQSGDAFSIGLHTITATAADSSGNSSTGTFTIEVLPLHLIGTPNNDSYNALPGQEAIDAGLGTDTITFDFKLVDATVTYQGNKIIVDGPSGSHTVLTGFEVFNFTDGTVHNDDSSPLIDDLFYYSKYHDVWNAHVDADAHYNSIGWHEGRDPDAFFSTAVYLSANPDVKAAGVNPLMHFDAPAGRKAACRRSLSIRRLSRRQPGRESGGIDPLRHFLTNGAQEGRQPFAPGELVAANGFDYVYYLNHNPDVAAAGVDPFQHFQTVGWQGGRNPNALFDTNGYLATYTDVHANPLDHYNDSAGTKAATRQSASTLPLIWPPTTT